MKTSQTLSVSDLLPLMSETQNPLTGFTHYKATHGNFGTYENRVFKTEAFGVYEYKADLSGNFRISHHEEGMLNSMNLCVVFDGNISLDVKERGFSTELTSLKHHTIFAPEPAYDLVIDQFVHGVHIAIDLDYYANLLPDDEQRIAALKEDLHRKKMVWSGAKGLNVSMLQAVRDILNNPMQGSLRPLFLEAKVLEVVALQLKDFTADTEIKLKKQDEEVFHEIKAYLNLNFREDLSLRSLSRAFGINEFKLKKGFKAVFNTTVFDYIGELKMTYARTLLLDEKKYVNEVAVAIGYKNPNHFSTAFKRKYGVSPRSLK